MLNLASTSDVLRLVTASAVSNIEVHVSFVDRSSDGATITPGRTNTVISTATTTTIAGSPAASTVRNVKACYVTNDATANCTVSVEHYDGTNAVEIIQVILLPGENLFFNEEGRWVHRDANGAEYPPAGQGAYTGRNIPFMKSGTAADAVGYWYCTAKDAGFPGAWAPGSPGLGGRNTDGTVSADFGCVPIKNPATGANYLTELLMAASINHQHVFFDCLWVNSGINMTSTSSAQTINSATLPARDINGSTDGEGLGLALYFSAASTLAAVNALLTVSYTNSAGTSGRTATLTSGMVGSQIPATPVVGTLVWLNLQAGDTGVRSVQSINIGATSFLTGTMNLMITRDIATIGTTIVNIPAYRLMDKPGVRLYNNSCILHCVLASATTATFFSGELAVMER